MKMFKFLENVRLFDEIVCQEAECMFADAEEIGSSDMSICARYVLQNFYSEEEMKAVGNEEFWIVKNAIRNAIANGYR